MLLDSTITVRALHVAVAVAKRSTAIVADTVATNVAMVIARSPGMKKGMTNSPTFRHVTVWVGCAALGGLSPFGETYAVHPPIFCGRQIALLNLYQLNKSIMKYPWLYIVLMFLAIASYGIGYVYIESICHDHNPRFEVISLLLFFLTSLVQLWNGNGLFNKFFFALIPFGFFVLIFIDRSVISGGYCIAS